MGISAKNLRELHLDELRGFAVRDPEKIVVGDKLLFVHIPELALNSEWSLPSAAAHVIQATVKEIGPKRFQELDPTANFDDEPQLAIIYRDSTGTLEYRYASDAGVIPYGNERYNPVNFTVRVAELKDQGIAPLFSTTEAYERMLQSRRAQLTALRASLWP